MRFEAKQAAPGVAAVALVAAAIAMLSGGRALYGDPTGQVPLEMPATLGPWTAEPVRFCMNDQCAASFLESQLPEGAAECPVCGSELGSVSVGEKRLLPANTPIFRRVYRRDGHPDVMATFVFSGMERQSIHKPQRCLVAQGNRITDEYTHRAACDRDGGTLPVRVLEIARPVRDSAGQVVSTDANVYVYWLFNPERETVHHWSRLWRTVWDNAIRSYRPRWGYASITIPRDLNSPDGWKNELDDFLPRLYPVVKKLRSDLDARRNRVMRLGARSWENNVYEGTNAALSSVSAPAPAAAPAED